MSASLSASRKKKGLRTPSKLPSVPQNLKDRIIVQVRPDGSDFVDTKVVKCISQLCLQNWPTATITWTNTPSAHKNACWQQFKKLYK